MIQLCRAATTWASRRPALRCIQLPLTEFSTARTDRRPSATQRFISVQRSVTFAPSDPAPPTLITYAPKPWLDDKRSIENRVNELLEAASIHPGDFHDTAMQDLVKQCCVMGSLEGLQLAQDVVDRLLVEKRRLQATGKRVFVPIQIVQTLLYGWAVLSTDLRVAHDRMREVLQLGIDEAKQDTIFTGRRDSIVTDSQPNVNFFNTYLQGLVNAARITSQAALDGEAMINEMSEYNRALGWHTKPNTRSYTHVIMAFARTGHPGSGQRAFNLLQTMKQVHQSEKATYEQEYNTSYNVLDPEDNKRQIVTPDAAVYTSVMKALVESNRTPEKVIDLLSEAIGAEGVILDEGLFTMTMRSLGSKIDVERNAKTRVSIAKQSEEILHMMVQYAKTKQFSQPTLNEASDHKQSSLHSPPLLSGYNACLDTWARAYCKEAAPKCNSMLENMMKGDGVQPNTVSFNSCLYAWSRAHKFHANAAERAEDLLKLQHDLSQPDLLGDSVKPDFQSYTICILSLAESNLPNKMERAVALLDSLIDCVSNGQLSATRNPTAPFSAVLVTIADSGKPQSVAPKGSYVATSDKIEDGFTSTVDTQADPFTIAKSIFAQIEGDVHRIGTSVDHHAISAFMKCVVAHCAPGSTERDHTARQTFDNACELGHVSRSVIQGLKDALGPAASSIQDIYSKTPPRYWSRNVSAKFR